MYQEFIEKHLEKHVGPIEFEWEGLLFVRASESHNCHLVMTRDMSSRSMNAPKDEWKFLELCALLPADWPLEPDDWNEDDLWPLRGLQMLSRLPFQTDSWLGLGHTIPNGNPPQPFASSTNLCCWLLLPPVELEPSFSRTFLPDGEVLNVLNLVPIFEEELKVKRNQGFPTLIELFGKKGVSDIINPNRSLAIPGQGLKRWVTGT